MEPLPIPDLPALTDAERVALLERDYAILSAEYNAALQRCAELRSELRATGDTFASQSAARRKVLEDLKAEAESRFAEARRAVAQRDRLALDFIRLHAVASDLFWMLQSGADVRREAVVLKECGEVVELLRQLQTCGKLPRA